MKTFHYPLGHQWGTTMTVGELIEKLSTFDANMPVLAEWEEQDKPFCRSFVVKENFHRGKEDEACSALLINVD